MKRFVLSIVLTALFAVAGRASDLTDRNVGITAYHCDISAPNLFSTGSGVKTGSNRILTAAHLRPSSDCVLVVGRSKARVVRFVPERDLMLLEADNIDAPAIRFGTIYEQERVVAVGNPLGVSDVVTFGQVAFIRHGDLFHTASVMPGSSGGGVYNVRGELVGITSKVLCFYTCFSIATVVEESDAGK